MGMREKMIELLSDAELPMKCDGRTVAWYALGYDEALYMADHLIANDIVPVVRCKDCKHYDNSEGICWCHLNSKFFPGGMDWHGFPEDGFCSYGERKDND